jgi:hypothetical protein
VVLSRAVIDRTVLPAVGYAIYELWRIDNNDRKIERLRIAPVDLVRGRPDPSGVEQAKYVLRGAARQGGLEIVREAE